MQKQKKQLSNIEVVFTTLWLVVLSLIVLGCEEQPTMLCLAVLGCEEQPSEALNDKSTAPDKVNIIKGVVTTDSISLLWMEPEDKGKKIDGTPASIIGYKVYYKTGNTVTAIDENLLNKDKESEGIQTTTTAIISGLTTEKEYAMIVVTSNSAGLTSTSSTVTQRTQYSQFTKLRANGQPLEKQDGTWSNQGSENAGSKWSCVLDNRNTIDTADDLYWEIKTDDGGERDKDNEYKWGGLTAIRRDDSNRKGDYYDDWNALVNEANDQKFTDDDIDGNVREANDDAKTALCGYINWRVPTIDELKTLQLDSKTNGWYINREIFPNTKNWYWTSSPRARNSSYESNNNDAWVFDFENGYNSFLGYRYNTYYVRLVRERQ